MTDHRSAVCSIEGSRRRQRGNLSCLWSVRSVFDAANYAFGSSNRPAKAPRNHE